MRAIRAIRPDLLLAVDQEGGRVQRLRQGFVRLPAMRAIADNPNAEELAERCGWLMATEVQAVSLDLVSRRCWISTTSAAPWS